MRREALMKTLFGVRARTVWPSRSISSFLANLASIFRLRRFLFQRALGRHHLPWLAPFLEEVWGFHHAGSRAIVLHYDPAHDFEVFPEFLLLQCQRELKALAQRFGFRLPRVNVFVFQTPQLV